MVRTRVEGGRPRRAQRAANSSQRRRERGIPIPRKPSRNALVIGGGHSALLSCGSGISPSARMSRLSVSFSIPTVTRAELPICPLEVRLLPGVTRKHAANA